MRCDRLVFFAIGTALTVLMSGCDMFAVYNSEDRPQIITGVNDDHTVITEPLVQIRPLASETDPKLVIGNWPSMGIEGGKGFVRAEIGGEVVFDAIVDREPFWLPEAGDYRLTVYSRSCDGNCGLLDMPVQHCAFDKTLRSEMEYRITIEEDGHCWFADEKPAHAAGT
jgi:hypothetical protein